MLIVLQRENAQRLNEKNYELLRYTEFTLHNRGVFN